MVIALPQFNGRQAARAGQQVQRQAFQVRKIQPGTLIFIGAALGGVPKHVVIDSSMAPPMVMGPPLYGSPETVLGKIKEIHDVLGMDRLEVSLGTINPLSHDAMLSSLKLIGEEIVPVLHDSGFARSDSSVPSTVRGGR